MANHENDITRQEAIQKAKERLRNRDAINITEQELQAATDALHKKGYDRLCTIGADQISDETLRKVADLTYKPEALAAFYEAREQVNGSNSTK